MLVEVTEMEVKAADEVATLEDRSPIADEVASNGEDDGVVASARDVFVDETTWTACEEVVTTPAFVDPLEVTAREEEAGTKLVVASSGIDEMDSTTEAEVVAATALVVTPAALDELEARTEDAVVPAELENAIDELSPVLTQAKLIFVTTGRNSTVGKDPTSHRHKASRPCPYQHWQYQR